MADALVLGTSGPLWSWRFESSFQHQHAGITQLVECQFSKLNVASSILATCSEVIHADESPLEGN